MYPFKGLKPDADAPGPVTITDENPADAFYFSNVFDGVIVFEGVKIAIIGYLFALLWFRNRNVFTYHLSNAKDLES